VSNFNAALTGSAVESVTLGNFTLSETASSGQCGDLLLDYSGAADTQLSTFELGDITPSAANYQATAASDYAVTIDSGQSGAPWLVSAVENGGGSQLVATGLGCRNPTGTTAVTVGAIFGA